MTPFWLIRREAGASWPVAAALAVLLAALTAVSLGWPARFDRLADRTLAGQVARAQESGALVTADGATSFPSLGPGDAVGPLAADALGHDLDRVGSQAEQHLGRQLAGVLGDRRGQAETEGAAVLGVPTVFGRPPLVELAYRQQADPPAEGERLRYVEGRAPGPTGKGEDAPIEVAASEATRDALGLHVGGRFELKSDVDWGTPAVLVGVFHVDSAAARFWQQLPLLTSPLKTVTPRGQELDGELLTSQAGLATARDRGRVLLSLGWDWTATTGRGSATGAGLAALRGQLARLGQYDPSAFCDYRPGLGCRLTGLMLNDVTVGDRLTPVLTDFADRRDRTVQLQGFALAGLLTVVVATGFAAARLNAHRRGGAFELQRLRGAGRGQPAGRLLLEALPAVLLGLGAGRLLAGLLAPPGYPPGAEAGGWPPVLAAAVLLGCAPAAVLLLAPLAAQGRVRARRLVLEALVVLLAAAALAGLRLRGDAAGADPQLVLTPSLLALVLVLALLRLVPPLVRLAARAAARGRGAVPLLGLARAAGLGAAALPVLLVLVLAMGGGVFGGLVSSTVAGSRQRVADWRTGGAAAALVGPLDRLPGPSQADRAVGGAGAVAVRAAGGDLTAQEDGTVFPRSTLVGVDPAGLRGLEPGSPLAAALLGAGLDRAPVAAGGASGQEPVLSALGDPELAAAYPGGTFEVAAPGQARFLVQLAGTLSAASAADPALGPVLGDQPRHTALLVFAGDAAQRLPHQSGQVSALLVGSAGPGPEPDRAALAALAAERYGAPGGLGAPVQLRVRQEELAALTSDGLVRSTGQAFLGATGLGLLLGLGTVLLDLLLSSAERGRTLARLRTLGLGGRAATGLSLLQLLPLVLAAVAGGAALGLLLPSALGGALRLRGITGGPDEPAVHHDWTLTAGLGAGPALLVLGAVALEAVLGRRRRVRAVLRLGEEL
ncbi:hypothetical protein ACFYNO_10145 [Kitasatospora sp. NPDC006697]|uniref:hypothetical protein n=1 Tax=Kitasatospora sp. NPDC006697 TaxID=3364020 RepID=UPI00367BDD7C